MGTTTINKIKQQAAQCGIVIEYNAHLDASGQEGYRAVYPTGRIMYGYTIEQATSLMGRLTRDLY